MLERRKPRGRLFQHLWKMFVVGQVGIREDEPGGISLDHLPVEGGEPAICHLVVRAQMVEDLEILEISKLFIGPINSLKSLILKEK